MNGYAKKHRLKISANWAYTKFERQASGRLPEDSKKDILQIQAQLYF
jgi:hypothetical protein